MCKQESPVADQAAHRESIMAELRSIGHAFHQAALAVEALESPVAARGALQLYFDDAAARAKKVLGLFRTLCKKESPAETSSPVLERLRKARAELAAAELEFGRNIPLCASRASDGKGDIELGLLDEGGHRRVCRLDRVGAAVLVDTLARFVAEPSDVDNTPSAGALDFPGG